MFFLYIFLLLRWHSDVENHEIGTFRVNFLFKKHSNLSKKHFIEEYQCRTTIFVKYIFDNFKIEWLLFLKWLLIFDTSPLTQFSKFNNFLWVCWFLGKNLSNFVPPFWKLHNPYCHYLHNDIYSVYIGMYCK